MISRKGSSLLRELRQQRDREKNKDKFWEVKGSKLGKAIGVGEDGKVSREIGAKVNEEAQRAKREAAEGGGDADGDHRKRAQYSSAMFKNAKAQSEFAKTKTIGEQRRSLPIYTCRKDLIEVIRDHQVIVVVGETGSGMCSKMKSNVFLFIFCLLLLINGKR